MLIDVCCGGGAIGLDVARAAVAAGASTRVVGLEVSGEGVADARRNAAANGLQGLYEARCVKAEDGIAAALGGAAGAGAGGEGAAWAAAVLDPPRTGLAPAPKPNPKPNPNASPNTNPTPNPNPSPNPSPSPSPNPNPNP